MSQTRDPKWRALALTGLAVILSLSTWFSATAVAPELATTFELSAGQVAWLTNAVQLGFVTGALLSSVLALADVLPLTRLMAGAALLAALANAAVLLEPTGNGAILSRFCTGFALAAIYPPAMKFIATWFQAGRGLAMGVMVGALTLGSALPHLVRALSAGLDWRAVIGASSLACLLAAFLFAFVLREGPHAFTKAPVDLRQVGAILRNKPVMLANLGYFGHMWELYAMWAWIAAYAGAAGALQSGAMSPALLAFAVIASGAVGCVLAGWLAERFGRCLVTTASMLTSGSAALLIGLVFAGPPAVFIAVAMIWGFSVVADSAQFSAAVTELSDTRYVGASLAFQMGVGFAITILTIWLVPIIADGLGGWRWSFLILVPGPLLGSWAMLRLRQMPEATALAGGLR